MLCNKCSPFPPSSCSVRRRRAAVARHPSPPALLSRPPARPAGNTVSTTQIMYKSRNTDDTDLPHYHDSTTKQRKLKKPSTAGLRGRRLVTSFSANGLHATRHLRPADRTTTSPAHRTNLVFKKLKTQFLIFCRLVYIFSPDRYQRHDGLRQPQRARAG